MASGTGSSLISTTVPRMLPVLVFADSADCADAGTTRSNPPARKISSNMCVTFRNAPSRRSGVVGVLLCIVDISSTVTAYRGNQCRHLAWALSERSYEAWAEAGDFALSLRGGIASKWMSC